MNAKLLRSAILSLVIVAMTAVTLKPSLAIAQSSPTPVETHSPGGPRRQLATILFAGLGGAVLGLSTLSFYGRPQDKLANIAIGFAGGVIIGTAIVTYKAATNPTEFYGTRPLIEDDIDKTNRAKMDSAPLKAPTFAMTFDF